MDEPRRLYAFWMPNANFGDNCNLYLLARLSGRSVIFTGISEPEIKIVAIGSILNWCDERCIAWGPGLASRTDCVNPKADIRAARGPLSRDQAHRCGNNSSPAIGDPAMLLPLVYKPRVKKAYRYGIVPHYVDQVVMSRIHGSVSAQSRLINIMESPEDVIDALVSCEYILSSSLHGLIAAQAYGVPAAWVDFGGPIGGDGMKYQDYFQSLGISVTQPVDFASVSNLAEIERAAANVEYSLPKLSRVPELLQSMPFPAAAGLKSS